MKLRPMQQELFDLLLKGHSVLIEQSRQTGITEVIARYVTYVMMNPGARIMILSEHEDRQNYLLNMIRKIIPTRIVDISENNEREIKLANGSYIRSVSILNLERNFIGRNIDTVIIESIDHSKFNSENYHFLRYKLGIKHFIFTCQDPTKNRISKNIVKASLGIKELEDDPNLFEVFKHFVWYKALWYSNPERDYKWYKYEEGMLGTNTFHREISRLNIFEEPKPDPDYIPVNITFNIKYKF
jgi:hypothetical protein